MQEKNSIPQIGSLKPARENNTNQEGSLTTAQNPSANPPQKIDIFPSSSIPNEKIQDQT